MATIQESTPTRQRRRDPASGDVCDVGLDSGLGQAPLAAEVPRSRAVDQARARAGKPIQRPCGSILFTSGGSANPDAPPGLREHRAEVRELVDRLGDSRPQLHAVTYPQLFVEWRNL